ncbi:MAG: hypothetical protein VX000_00720, partial [Myxococcota bacterium]|nr:hypothetical protein [Myxococcota bacterium]
ALPQVAEEVVPASEGISAADVASKAATAASAARGLPRGRLISGLSLMAVGGGALAASVPFRSAIQDNVESSGTIDTAASAAGLHNGLVIGGYSLLGLGAATLGTTWLRASTHSVTWGFSW